MRKFKTESKKLLDLMINSIYTNREIFLRELISNASDAVDKLYFRSLTDPSVAVGRDDLAITVGYDSEARTVTVSDNGAGMSADTLARLRAALSDASPMKGSIGLKNTVTRMNLLYGESFSTSIDSTPDHGSTFTLRFPFIQ